MSDVSHSSDTPLEVLLTGRTLPAFYAARSVVWPVFAWRVDATLVTRRDRDPLQRAILRLAQQNVLDHVHVGQLLGVGPDLVRHVQLLCSSMGLLDARMTPTLRGDKLVDLWAEQESQENLETGWVFREAVTGEVMPFCILGRPLPAADRRSYDRDFLPGDEAHAGRPTARSLSVALRQCRRLAAFQDTCEDGTGLRGDLVDPDNTHADCLPDGPIIVDWTTLTDDGPSDTSPLPVTRVPVHIRVIGSRPERVGFEVLLYAEPDRPDSWRVSPPLRETGGWWYRRRLEWAAERALPVQSILDRLLSDARTRFIGTQAQAGAPSGSPVEIAGLEASDALAPVAQLWRRALDAWRLYERGEDTADAIIVRCQSALEALLKVAVRATSSYEEVGRLLAENPSHRLVSEMAGNLGLARVPSSFFASGLFARASAPRSHMALRDRGVFLVFAAAHGYNQPFAKACYQCPEILILLDQVAVARNQEAHAGRSTPASFPLTCPEEILFAAKQIADALVPFLPTES